MDDILSELPSCDCGLDGQDCECSNPECPTKDLGVYHESGTKDSGVVETSLNSDDSQNHSLVETSLNKAGIPELATKDSVTDCERAKFQVSTEESAQNNAESAELALSTKESAQNDHANTLAVQSQIADALLERISEGLAGMEAPTNAKDLLAMVETWRKLKGLDAKQGVQSGGILTPMRSVSRQPRRIG